MTKRFKRKAYDIVCIWHDVCNLNNIKEISVTAENGARTVASHRFPQIFLLSTYINK